MQVCDGAFQRAHVDLIASVTDAACHVESLRDLCLQYRHQLEESKSIMASLLDDPNDEVVQDSEDEEYLSASLTDLVKASTSRGKSASKVYSNIHVYCCPVSSIQTAAFSPIVNKPRGVSPPKDRLSISSFTHTGNSSAGKDPAPVYERPRPRRVMPKPKQDANSSLQSSIADTSMNLAASTSIADFSTSPNMMGIAERAKLRAQNSTKATVSSSIHTSTLNTSYAKHRTPTIIDVIELTSDSDRDELSLSPVSSKSKSKRKLKSVHASNTNKRSKTSHSSHSLRPTSPVIPTLPLFLSSSGLPPSDPPPPTSTYDLPPIAVLENSDSSFDQDVDMDPGKRDAGRGQSPLFSQETEKLVNKPRQARKRKRPAVDDDDDGVNVDVDAQRMPPPALPQPPPTFFAGSSSSVASAPIDGPIETPAASKSIKKRKAKADDDDYSVVDDDGPRPKPAAKAKKPKGKGKKAVIDDNVEVVIEVKAKGKGKGKASAKGKGKGKEKEKEVYKSKEFVNDEDDDDGDFNQGVVDASKIVPSKPKSTISLSSVSESGAEAAGPATTKDVDAPDKTDWMDAAEGESGQPFGTVVVQKKTGKASGTARGKGKGRQVIVSDDEGEDDEGEDASVALEKDTQTKEKPNAKAKGKGKERMPPPPDPDSASDDERASKAKGGDQVVKV